MNCNYTFPIDFPPNGGKWYWRRLYSIISFIMQLTTTYTFPWQPTRLYDNLHVSMTTYTFIWQPTPFYENLFQDCETMKKICYDCKVEFVVTARTKNKFRFILNAILLYLQFSNQWICRYMKYRLVQNACIYNFPMNL